MESLAQRRVRGCPAARNGKYATISPFQGNVAEGQLFSPAYSVECLLEVLNRMKAMQSGSFVDWAGESIPW
ncbi:hypothetical protein [Psychrobacter sp. JCM 18903]|uniref:hypothetical protein n=1 Tax=Psychrobacter sp. JCM 18903 TaxID=1298610 RepID=UPI001FB175BC|nr:hypothetical protein [Psychrobacter sp. JCM 18903]